MRVERAREHARNEASQQLKKNLRRARLQCKLTQEEVAERIGVAAEVYGRMERGGFVPRVGTLRKLSLALGVSVDQLLGLHDPGAEPFFAPPPEDRLPLETRRVLRVVRGLPPDTMRIWTTTAHALLEAKGKRRKARV